MNTLVRDKFNKTNEAIDKISALGYKVEKVNEGEIQFYFKNKIIYYYPKKEWASGSSIVDCRGLDKLLQQIKPKELISSVSVNQIKNKLVEAISEAQIKSETAYNNELYLRYCASVDAFQFVLDYINGEQ